MREFANTSYSTFDLSSLNINKQVAIDSLTIELEEEFRELNSEETLRARLDHFKIDNAQASDFSERIIDIGGGRKILCGIRHEGANPDLPFVHIIPNFGITKSESIKLYNEHLKKYFNLTRM